jgi:hypothetical protein
MENLYFKKTKYTVGVNFSAEKGLLEMDGASYPENAFEFYAPLMSWLTQYVKESTPPEIMVNLRINYLNTSSSKCMYDFLELLGTYREGGGKLKINWYYQHDDDMLEAGRELMDDTAVDMTFIAY